jgi:hypothetical protein
MSDTIIASIIAAITSAGVIGLIQFYINRHDKKKADGRVRV